MKLEMMMGIKEFIANNQKLMIIIAAVIAALIAFNIIFKVVTVIKARLSKKRSAAYLRRQEEEYYEKQQRRIEEAQANRARQELIEKKGSGQYSATARLIAYEDRTVEEWRKELKTIVAELLK